MISVSALQQNNKVIYVGILSTLIVFLLMDYIPALAPFSHWVTPPVALFLGLIFALVCGQAHPKFNKKTSKYLLQYSVVGLGFGMNLQASLASGKEGMEFTILSVIGTMLIGMFIGRKILKIDRDTSYLISSGTAICGGSAIAAVGPVLKAKDSEMSVAYASAQSSDATASKKKAMTGARTALENQIKTKAEAAAKSQTKISGADIAQFNSLIQGVIQQEVVKMKVICENSEQAGGRYKTHIVVEVTKASVLTNIVNSAKSDEKLKANFEEGKFKQAF